MYFVDLKKIFELSLGTVLGRGGDYVLRFPFGDGKWKRVSKL